MSNINLFFSKFRRITSNGSFIPEIDGLRFLAILTVILFHLQSLILLNPNYGAVIHSSNFRFLERLFTNGWQGVELFFVISGFILGMPFAKHYLQGTPKVSIKSYFLRRVSRLEPPYFLLMIVFFGLNVLKNEHSPGLLFQHLLASLAYLHNIIFGNEIYLVSVAWSLEIEVQFYILAPLLAYVFRLPKLIRRIVLVSGIMVFSSLLFYAPCATPTLYTFIQYFLIGFLLVDVYIETPKIKIAKSLEISLGSIALLAILMINSHESLFTHSVFIVAIFILYLLTLTTNFWKKVFSLNFIATTGGMCYSIYLLHTPILHLLRSRSHYLKLFDEYTLNLIVLGLIAIPIIIVISAIFFYYIEKPCMKKQWYKDIFSKKVDTKNNITPQ